MLEQDKEYFNKLFDEFYQVKYKPEWTTGIYQLSGFLYDDEVFNNSNKVKFYDDHGRRCIGIKKHYNIIAVIYEKYINNNDVIISDMSDEFIYNFLKELNISYKTAYLR